MNLVKDLQRKITLVIYDHKNMTSKANKIMHSLKEVERMLDSVGKPKGISGK